MRLYGIKLRVLSEYIAGVARVVLEAEVEPLNQLTPTIFTK